MAAFAAMLLIGAVGIHLCYSDLVTVLSWPICDGNSANKCQFLSIAKALAPSAGWRHIDDSQLAQRRLNEQTAGEAPATPETAVSRGRPEGEKCQLGSRR